MELNSSWKLKSKTQAGYMMFKDMNTTAVKALAVDLQLNLFWGLES